MVEVKIGVIEDVLVMDIIHQVAKRFSCYFLAREW